MPSFSSLLSSLSMLDLDLVWLKTEEECGIELVAVFQPIRPGGERIPLLLTDGIKLIHILF